MTNLDKVRIAFEARINELTVEAKEIDTELRTPDTADSEDRATESEDDEVLEGLGRSAIEEIKEIRAAIKRIDVGTYGTCTSCHEPISDARLQALPHAAKCITCSD